MIGSKLNAGSHRKTVYLSFLLSIVLILVLPLIFSSIYSDETNRIANEGSTRSVLIVLLVSAIPMGVWLGLPLILFYFKIRAKRSKNEIIFTSAVLALGFLFFSCPLMISTWFENTFGLAIGERWVLMAGQFGLLTGGLFLLIDVKSIYRFFIESTASKRANTFLKSEEFEIRGYREKSLHLIKNVRNLKNCFRLLLLGLGIFCVYLSFQYVVYFLVVLVSIAFNFSFWGLLAWIVVLLQSMVTLYLISIVPITVVLIFTANLTLHLKKQKIDFQEASDDEFTAILRKTAAEAGLRAPIVMYTPDVAVPQVVTIEDRAWLLVNPVVVDLFLRNHPSELKAILMHEFSHIKNGDIKDKTGIYNVEVSLKKGTSRLVRVLGPLAALFPFSLILITLSPLPPLMASYLTVFAALLGLIALLFIGELLKRRIHLVNIALFMVSFLVGVVFLPFAIFWGKLNGLIEKRADLDAANCLHSREQVISMLHLLKTAVNTDPKCVIEQKGKEISAVFRNAHWKEYIVTIPTLVLDGIYEYFQRHYSNIDSRIENLVKTDEVHYTVVTSIKHGILYIGRSISDIPRNKASLSVFILCVLFSPVIFLIHSFPNGGNLILAGLYTLITILALSKAAKYFDQLLEIVTI